MDIKKKAHSLKSKAKELGYEIKHTHALEMVSSLEGHRSRHSALLEDQKEPTNHGISINCLCQICLKKPRTNARYIFSGNPQIWLLCEDCGRSEKESSKFASVNGAKDVTEHYDISQTYIRDISFIHEDKKTNHSYKTKKAFFFRLILSDGEKGDRYMFVPGLWSGHSEVKVWNLDKNEEANGWWDWPIELLPFPEDKK